MHNGNWVPCESEKREKKKKGDKNYKHNAADLIFHFGRIKCLFLPLDFV